MTLDLKVHHYKRDKKGRAVLVRSTPSLRLKNGDSEAIFIQGGQFFTDNGEEVKKVPPWVLEHLKNVKPEVKREVGLASDSVDKLP